jgi:DNA polymerase I
MTRIFLLDTMSFVYRAYHAAAHQSIQMTTKTGFPTGATYIFARMLKKLMETEKPEYLVACMEGGPSMTFREKLYPDYKANRRGERPNDLERQLGYIDNLIDGYHLQRVSVPGFEADDIIGTLATRFYKTNADNQIFIVSGDKDMMQLVNDRTFILNPMKDLLADAAKVEEIMGVPPSMVTQVMALRGDTVDNVPGAPGVGDKGSVALIKEFGSLTAALDRASEIKRKTYRESLIANRAQIELSHRLVTIDCAVPVVLDLDGMKMQAPDEGALKAIYKELEFSSLLKKEQMLAIEDFAEINQPDPTVGRVDVKPMSEEDTTAALDSFL